MIPIKPKALVPLVRGTQAGVSPNTPRTSTTTVSDITKKQNIGDLTTHIAKGDNHLWQALNQMNTQSNNLVDNMIDVIAAVAKLAADINTHVGSVPSPTLPGGGGTPGGSGGASTGGSGGTTTGPPPSGGSPGTPLGPPGTEYAPLVTLTASNIAFDVSQGLGVQLQVGSWSIPSTVGGVYVAVVYNGNVANPLLFWAQTNTSFETPRLSPPPLQNDQVTAYIVSTDLNFNPNSIVPGVTPSIGPITFTDAGTGPYSAQVTDFIIFTQSVNGNQIQALFSWNPPFYPGILWAGTMLLVVAVSPPDPNFVPPFQVGPTAPTTVNFNNHLNVVMTGPSVAEQWTVAAISLQTDGSQSAYFSDYGSINFQAPTVVWNV